MRIICRLDTIEFISWRSVDVIIKILWVGEFTSDIWLIGQQDNDSAKTFLEEFCFVAITHWQIDIVLKVNCFFVPWDSNKENF